MGGGDARHVVDRIEILAQQERRGNERRSPGAAPDDVGLGDIPAASGPNRQGWARPPRTAVDQSVTDNGHRDGLHRVSGACPQHLAGVGIVGVDRIAAADDDLGAVTDLNRDGRAPAGPGAPFLAPELTSRLLVEGDDEPRPGFASISTEGHLILKQDDPVPIEQRRSPRAVIQIDDAKAGVPHQLPVEIHGDDAGVPEIGIHQFSVGGCRGGGVTIFSEESFGGGRLRYRGLPEHCPVGTPEGNHRSVLSIFGGGRQENAILPDDRRGMAASRYGNLPQHILGRRPTIGIAGALHQSLHGRSTPVGPVVHGRTGLHDHSHGRRRGRRTDDLGGFQHRPEPGGSDKQNAANDDGASNKSRQNLGSHGQLPALLLQKSRPRPRCGDGQSPVARLRHASLRPKAGGAPPATGRCE
jgi:hypothetical protein